MLLFSPTGPRKKLDVGLILGAAGRNSEKDFAIEQKIAKRIVESFHISPTTTRIGILLYGRDARMMAKLNSYSNRKSMVEYLDRLRNPGDGSRIDKALGMASTELFTEGNGDRAQVPNTLIVFMNRKAEVNPLQAARYLKDLGVKVIAIGIGDQVDVGELKDISGNEKDVFTAKEPEDVNKVAASVIAGSSPGT